MTLWNRRTACLQQPDKASGPLTVAALLLAFAVVNLPLRTIYKLIRHTPVAVRVGSLLVDPRAALGIAPLFVSFGSVIGLANVAAGQLSKAIALGTALAHFVGKPVGNEGIGWIPVRLGIAQFPYGVRWPQRSGASMLAGIGFTMSLFLAGVAFGTSDALAILAKVGILVGLLVSAALGIAFLTMMAARRTRTGEHERQAV